MKTFVVDVKESGEDLYIELPEELLKLQGWKEGDELNWIDNKDGSYTLKKRNTVWVMVDCVSTFRTRYMVEVPASNPEWALDTVTCEDAQEFSQGFLGEQIFSHRTLTSDQAMEQCNVDNKDYAEWSDEKKREVFFTKWTDDETK